MLFALLHTVYLYSRRWNWWGM